MLHIEPLSAATVDAVVARIVTNQVAVNQRHPLICANVDAKQLREALMSHTAAVAVARDGDDVLGHLRGTVVGSDPDGSSVWVGPDSVSFNEAVTVEELYSVQAANWLEQGASRQFVWTPYDDCAPWLDLGFAYVHQRGAIKLNNRTLAAMPAGYHARIATRDDLLVALELDAIMDDEQRASPSFLVTHSDARAEWSETLDDPQTVHLIVECAGEPVAQCVWFPLDARVGTFDRTVHLSAVTVRGEHRRHGVARAMVDQILELAYREGYDYAETNWRVSNRRAAHYWASFGFTATYTRLQRTIGVG